MKLVAYVDESGTDGNSEVLIVGGFVASGEEWAKFRNDWQRVLNSYSARYFHFREWAEASAVARNKRKPSSKFGTNPYKTWNQETLDGFLFALAEVAAADAKLVVGGYVPPNMLRADQASGIVNAEESAEELCVSHFFNSVVSAISNERPVVKRQEISVCFDHSENRRWKTIVCRCYESSCKKHRQYRALTFASSGLKDRVESGDVEFLPLQAADMVAYRLRQTTERLVRLEFSGPDWDKLDKVLFRSVNESRVASNKLWLSRALRRVFVVPQGLTDEQAIASIRSSGRKRVGHL